MCDAAGHLKAVLARARAAAEGIPWVVTPEQRQRRAGLLAGAYVREPKSLTGSSWPFDGHEDQELGGVDRAEYRRLWQAQKKRGAPGRETQRAASPARSEDFSDPEAGQSESTPSAASADGRATASAST